MTDLEREYLALTCGILIDYDGYRDVEGLKRLLDETRERINALLRGEITSLDDLYHKE